MSTHTARQSKKAIHDWLGVLNAIPSTAVTTGTVHITPGDIIRVDETPALPGIKDKYLIGVEQQRTLNVGAARKLLSSFQDTAPHITSELTLCRPLADPTNIYVPDGQTRLLALLLGPMSKSFRFTMYDGVTPEQMVALFELNSYRRNTSTTDRISLHRHDSPVFQLSKTPDEQLNPVFRLVLKGNKTASHPPRLSWIEMLAGWTLGMNGNGVPSYRAREAAGRAASASGWNMDKVERVYRSDAGIQAYRDTERMIAAVQLAAHLAHPVIVGTDRGTLSDVGKAVAARMATYEADKAKPFWQAVLTNPNRRVHSSFWNTTMLRILFCLVHDNGWDAVYRRLPWLVRDIGSMETKQGYTSGTAPHLRDLVEDNINYNARSGAIKFLTT